MSTLPRPSHVVALASAAIASGIVLQWMGWPEPHRTLEFSSLLLAAIVTSLPLLQPMGSNHWPLLRLTFVVEFTALLLFGPVPTLLVVAAGTLTGGLSDPRSARRSFRMLLRTAMVMLSIQAAAWVHRSLGGTIGQFTWPAQAAPIAGGVAAYCIVMGVVADVLVPLSTRRSINRTALTRLLQACPPHVVGASLAVVLAEMMARGAIQLLPVAAIPMLLVYRLYREYVTHVADEHRRREVIESLTQGMCVVNHAGQITFWNDALERILQVRRRHAIGHSLRAAVPGVGDTPLMREVDDVVASRRSRTLTHLGLRSAAGPRVLEVTILPVTEGVALLWQDVTEQTRAVQVLKRHGERLSLAAEGANDGLWEWDLRTQEFFVTSRWKAMMGLAPTAAIGKPDEWFDRVHPDDLASLKETIEAHLSGQTETFQHEHQLRHEDGSYRSFQCRGVANRRIGVRPTRIAGSLTDTTDLAITQEQLRNAVFLDPLTGLCNRAVFVEGLGRRLKEFQQRRNGDRFALLYLDLDRFKVVNDSLGHLIGDELLIAVSRRLETCLRQGDVLARLGGDEFAILLNGLHSEQQANVVAFRVQEALSKPFSISGREVFTSASIGIAFGLAQYTGPDEMMHDADTAMYHAKTRGKARHEVFDADMDARARDRLGLENDLRHAVASNDFEVHYQPIVSLASGMCVGFESLVRWTRDGKPVSPAMFIPIAEELGLIEPLGTRVLQEACRTFADWKRRFPDSGLDCITVNVSARQLMQQNFLSIVERAVQQARLKPCDLRIEITETALMTSPKVAAEVLSHLRDFGAKIYLDDFGTGYSSLSHLHRLPVDALKIDRSFVRSLTQPDRPAIVESILALARTLATSVVAEGIETEVQARELERLGCTHAQGFLFSRPLSQQAAEQILLANRPLGPKGADLTDRLAPTGTQPERPSPLRLVADRR